jgi:hypothetical protein
MLDAGAPDGGRVEGASKGGGGFQARRGLVTAQGEAAARARVRACARVVRACELARVGACARAGRRAQYATP